MRNLTWEQAKELARQGKKIAHRHFCEGEYLTMHGDIIFFEDGVTLSEAEFKQYRKESVWNTGWSEYND